MSAMDDPTPWCESRSTFVALGGDTTTEAVMDRVEWFIQLASAILAALMLLVRGRRNGWI